jgi:uncharacterized membrane protein YeaQ/YmgE (transglycosylase-associated protein family)
MPQESFENPLDPRLLNSTAECVASERTRRCTVSLFAWIVLGLLAGFIASHMVNHLFGLAGVTRLNLYSIIVATAGAILFLVLYHAIRRNVVGRRVF